MCAKKKNTPKSHIPGTINIPLSEFPARVDEISEDAPVILVCNTGVRSSQAALFLAGMGYDQDLDLQSRRRHQGLDRERLYAIEGEITRVAAFCPFAPQLSYCRLNYEGASRNGFTVTGRRKRQTQGRSRSHNRFAGKYVGDIKLPGMCHVAFLRSPYAHAKILNIDTAAAAARAGVVAVVTGEDLQAINMNRCRSPAAITRLEHYSHLALSVEARAPCR